MLWSPSLGSRGFLDPFHDSSAASKMWIIYAAEICCLVSKCQFQFYYMVQLTLYTLQSKVNQSKIRGLFWSLKGVL